MILRGVKVFFVFAAFIGVVPGWSKSPRVAYDIEMAQEICAESPLENVEGIWLYPDDKVTVLILNDGEDYLHDKMSTYSISVIHSSDTRLRPGEVIGKLSATPDANTYRIHLTTERKNDLLLKPKSCVATLSKDGDTFLIKKQKVPFKGRLNFNFNRLLPGFWKVVSTGVSSTSSDRSVEPPAGMIKLYPSYDGNGSSRKKIRYL